MDCDSQQTKKGKGNFSNSEQLGLVTQQAQCVANIQNKY